MRGAPPPLLLVGALAALVSPPAAAAAAVAPSEAPAAAAGLLVLSDACRLQTLDARAHATLQLVSDNSTAASFVTILSHQESCGKEWRRRVTGAALSSLGSGQRVALTGRGGDAAVCAALGRAARALGGGALRAPGCARLAAAAAALAGLARALHWRAATLLSHTPHCIELVTAAGIPLVDTTNVIYDGESFIDEPLLTIFCIEDSAKNETLVEKSAEETTMLYIAIYLDRKLVDTVNKTGSINVPASIPSTIEVNNSIIETTEKRRALNSRENILNSINNDESLRSSGKISKLELLISAKTDYEMSLDILESVQFLLGEGATDDNVYQIGVYERKLGRWRGAGVVEVRRGAARLSRQLRRWAGRVRSAASAPSHSNVLSLPLILSVVTITLAVIATATLLFIRVGGWGVRRRRRAEVVLSPEAVSHGAGAGAAAGMESMLACWLQQLREFGGPERPDLLPAPQPQPAPSDTHTRYKGDVVHLKYLGDAGETLELRSKATDVLLVMQGLRHENLNAFVGVLCSPRAALVWGAAARGSLEDVLVADDIRLDWTFRLSLLTDLARGLRALHASPLRAHGRLSSRNCVVDARWVLRLTDYGLPALRRAQGLPTPHETPRDLLWTAPEVLRGESGGAPAADVFAVGIIMQEVIVRGEPYCMMSLTPEEIVEKVRRPPPLIRPSVSMGAAPPEAVGLMRQCWAEAPDARPDAAQLYDSLRRLHRGGKVNIVDSMFEMLEKYSNNLEELIKERTEQLDLEKRRTEQLLNRMLPRSVAERLLAGARVEPEEFSDVSIYFSDIVGFTELAARSTPVQVVDLLNDLYTRFDAAIQQYQVYKVETIGDAYMVVGGLPVRSRSHAAAVATMALHLLHEAGRFRIRHLPGAPLHLRSGLHSGPVCAAVVGATMPRYCLFGDAVNTAARMESSGAAWRVQVSAATAARLLAAGGFRLRSRGLTHIKGKGKMHTYWLLGKDGFDRPLPTPPPLPTEETLLEAEVEAEPLRLPTELEISSPPPAVTSPRVTRQFSAPASPLDPPEAASARPFDHDLHRAASADSNADGYAPPGPLAVRAPSVDRAAPYSRYKCGSGGRVLRRQWSLERGEALAAAAAAAADAVLAPRAPRPAPRYRMRPDAP